MTTTAHPRGTATRSGRGHRDSTRGLVLSLAIPLVLVGVGYFMGAYDLPAGMALFVSALVSVVVMVVWARPGRVVHQTWRSTGRGWLPARRR